MLRVLVPMAGPPGAVGGKRFGGCKALAEIGQRPMIQHVYDNLSALGRCRFVFVIRRDDAARFHLNEVLSLLDPGCAVVQAEGDTRGAACSALLAVEHIAADEPLVIANGDQILAADLGAVANGFRDRGLDGGIVVFDAIHPRWSYVRVDRQGLVVEAAEKRPISRLATAGLYYFRRGGDFVTAATEMIRKDDHVGSSFYVCPSYNQLVLRQARIGVHEFPRDAYFSLATPRGVARFERHLNRAAAGAGGGR
jgi:hypothetical protein